MIQVGDRLLVLGKYLACGGRIGTALEITEPLRYGKKLCRMVQVDFGNVAWGFYEVELAQLPIPKGSEVVATAGGPGDGAEKVCV